MSIANEITRLQNAKANIKTAIENKGVTVGDGTIDTYAEKIGEISGGGTVQNPLEYALTISGVYQNTVFPDGYELTLNLPNITSLASAFYTAKGIKKLTLKGNTAGNVVSFNRAFRNISAETIDLTEFNAILSNCEMAFMYSHIVEILGEIDFSNVIDFGMTFEGLSTLVTITPKKETIKLSISFAQSSKLSDLSIQSIIEGLADLTGGTAQTLTLHSIVGGKLTDEQKATITAKNWTLVY